MKVFELLTMLNKPRYKVVFYNAVNLNGEKLNQREIKLNLLNREVRDYYFSSWIKEIRIWLKEEAK